MRNDKITIATGGKELSQKSPKGLAKASPNFKDIQSDTAKASEEEKEKLIENNSKFIDDSGTD